MSYISPSRRNLLVAASALALFGGVGCGVAQTTPPAPRLRLRLVGETRLPHKLAFQNTVVGGLSGLDFDAATGTVYLISDDGGSDGPPRFYTARVTLSADKLDAIELTSVVLLKGLTAPDPEAIRWHAPSQSLLWTSEGNALLGAAPSLQQAQVDGTLIRSFALPPMFKFGVFDAATGQGPRINKTFEGLAITPDGRSAWLAMEAALRQDGPVPTVAAPGGPCRFTQIDIASGEVLKQIAYLPDAVARAPSPPSADADNGVVEVLMIDAHRMLVLERAYMAGLGDRQRNSIRLYAIDTRQASNTLGIAALKPGNYRPASKTLVADFADFAALSRLDNTEGMCWGPSLAGSSGGLGPAGGPGNRSLLFVSDDNFSARQITQFVAVEFMEESP